MTAWLTGMLAIASAIMCIGLWPLVKTEWAKTDETWWRNRAFATAHGCKPVPRLSRLRNCILTSKAWRKRKLLDLLHWKYTTIGNTHASATVGLSTIIFTVDPENIKTILAADFKKWYVKSEPSTSQEVEA